VWHGVVNPPRLPQITEWHYDANAVSLKQGEEMGRFLLGSTVVMLFGRDRLAFDGSWAAGKPVCLGEKMGETPEKPVS